LVRISSSDWAKARQVADVLADEWSVIQPSNGLCTKAAQLVDRCDLRARDALRLVAALEWCKDIPQWRAFWPPIKSVRGGCARRIVPGGFDGKRI
jgi:hypothetical protein